MDWFLYDNSLRHEKVKPLIKVLKLIMTELQAILKM